MPSHLKNSVYSIARLLFLTVLLMYCFNCTAYSQKYTFTHFNIEDGLPQSQATKFSQDNSHCLWIGTLCGASRYDGKEFTSYSKENGLTNNFIYSIYCDSKNRVWFGSNMGICCLDGKRLINYGIPPAAKRSWVTHIVEDGSGTIWLTMDTKLYKVSGSGLQLAQVLKSIDYTATDIAVDKAGNLHVAVFENGIYKLKGNNWVNAINLTNGYKNLYIGKILFDKVNSGKVYLLSYNSLFIAQNNKVIPYPGLTVTPANIYFTSITQDSNGNLWIGSSAGAYYLKNSKPIHFGADNGLSDAVVSDVYCDKDDNVWLATSGDGIYKYEGDGYVVYDQAVGIGGLKSVMGIARNRHKGIFLASDGEGIINYDGKEFKNIVLPGSNPNSKHSQCLYTDRDSNVWIGTSFGGIWKYDGHKFRMIPKTESRVSNSFSQDAEGALWIASPVGCFYLKGDAFLRLKNLNSFISSLLPLGKDSMLIGTQYGVRMAVKNKLVDGFKLPAIESSNILCMMKYRGLVLLGTGDRGLFIWNKKTGEVKNFNVKNGFNSNSIYNMLLINNNTIWAGTGRGLNRIMIDKYTGNCKILGGGNSKALVAEANQNSVLYNDGKVWMGTTKGLIIYNPKENKIVSKSKPFVMIQSVKLLDQQNHKAQPADVFATLNDGAHMQYDQNHLNISFLGVYLRSPGSISYQYQLVGLDDKFCSPVKNTVVDYPSLPPGQYTFRVKAITNEGAESDNIAGFSFEVTPPFYQTWFFRVLLLFSFVLIGISIQTFMHKRKLISVKQIEQMKREEKQKIRKQTAEDFHDDLGNKLTRITILSDILNAKMGVEKTDEKKLVRQIKQNAQEVYSGTKDILWALDPKSDNLYEILTHIKNFGIELFQDTAVEFEFAKIDASLLNIRLPMEYSRNMTMIYKELLNNVLKHASASMVKLTLTNLTRNNIIITLKDNGKGFDQQTTVAGNGTANVKSRAGRIGGVIDICSVIGRGTKITLNLNLKN
jgi:signal transduction histidine kinase/ligand-binding sensor domain-containing protein